jgi:dipeptidyl aminopeptidase/acylaminoacyl peptidase
MTSFRRLGLALLLALVALGAASATAAAPSGPRLAVSVSTPYPGGGEITTVGPTGADPATLAGGSGQRSADPHGDLPAWSPDGSLLAYTGSFGEYSPVVYVVGADGGRPRLVSKEGPLSDPIFSPDGRSLVFSSLRVVKGEFQRSARRADDEYGVVVDWAVLAVDVDDGSARLLTPWRRHQVLTPTSFSADGSTLAAERFSFEKGQQAVAITLGSGRTRVLAHNAEEPVYSPDGSRIAFVRNRYGRPSGREGNRPLASSTLLVMPAKGGRATKLATVNGGLAWPSWDPSSQRLSFTRLGGGVLGRTSMPHEGNSVMQVNADGSCLSRLLSVEPDGGTLYGSAWQPGPGREAGPIVC